MKSINLKKSLPERKKTTIDISNCNSIENIVKNDKTQIHLINKLYLDISFCEKHILINEIKSKISGYRQQDIDKQIYNPDTIITFEEITEKLLLSKMKCIYCKCNMMLFYKDQREPSQWTLDRINNNIDHSNHNTVISCLKCNLERRRRNMKDFKFTKQLSIVKK
tara:strand:- start:230 stop:724 length:495 start_codon:yes stop_codon:yes gene_type:complete